jgi:hypothetical protein
MSSSSITILVRMMCKLNDNIHIVKIAPKRLIALELELELVLEALTTPASACLTDFNPRFLTLPLEMRTGCRHPSALARVGQFN